MYERIAQRLSKQFETAMLGLTVKAARIVGENRAATLETTRNMPYGLSREDTSCTGPLAHLDRAAAS